MVALITTKNGTRKNMHDWEERTIEAKNPNLARHVFKQLIQEEYYWIDFTKRGYFRGLVEVEFYGTKKARHLYYVYCKLTQGYSEYMCFKEFRKKHQSTIPDIEEVATPMKLNPLSFQTMESSEPLGSGITREVWFMTTAEGEPVRRTLYKEEDGSVVAIQDYGKGLNTDLFVETMFYELFKGESNWLKIQADSGVYNVDHIHMFDMR
jgi:hypothetical protein